MALQSSGPIKMSEIKAATNPSSNSLRAYNVVAKAGTGNTKFDAPDRFSDFYSYGGPTTTTTTTTTTTLPPFSFTSVVASCINYEGSGRIVITVAGGSGQYQYSYDNGVNFTATTSNTSQTFDNLNDGNYVIKVKSVTDNVIYSYSSNPVVIDCLPILSATTRQACDDNGVGTIFFENVSGGSGNYSYRLYRYSDGAIINSNYATITGLDSYESYDTYLIDTANGYVQKVRGKITFNCTTTTTTTTSPPIYITYSTRLSGDSVEIRISSITGGTGTGYETTINYGSSWQTYSGAGTQYSGLSCSQAYVLIARDSANNQSQGYSINVACTTTTTTTTSTTTTTAAPRYRYLRYTYDTETCSTTSGPTPVWSYSNVGSGFYNTGDGNFYLSTSSHSDDTNQITIGTQIGCTTTTTTTTTTTCPPAGTLLSTFCGTGPDYHRYGVYTNGSCGTYNEILVPNDTTCGYTPPSDCTYQNLYITNDSNYVGDYFSAQWTNCDNTPGSYSVEITYGNLGGFATGACMKNGTLTYSYGYPEAGATC